MGEYKLVAKRTNKKDYSGDPNDLSSLIEGGVEYVITGNISVFDRAKKTVPALHGDVRINYLKEKAKDLMDKDKVIGELEITVKESPILLAKRAEQCKKDIEKYRKGVRGN